MRFEHKTTITISQNIAKYDNYHLNKISKTIILLCKQKLKIIQYFPLKLEIN
jgi:hypothetical protein